MIKSACTIGLMALALGQILSFSVAAQDPVTPSSLHIPTGNRLFLHVYARGTQIYRCVQDEKDTNRFSWVFVAPAADLYTDSYYKIYAGRHYAGPAWESADGSKVVGQKLQQADAPDSAAVPWLLLRSASVSGSGIFSHTTFIQRVNTHGGKLPPVAADRAHLGRQIEVPYTAEYLFYQPII
ncbi:MAG TPA: DUF3455 domain-containing protein [Puia sp.]|jgi:hypothetical protein|nr:DUF3455 domain-containing protein [Puia sp.]